MFRRNSMVVLLLLFPCCVAAQSIQGDQQAYCVYLAEQAKAQSEFLRTPTALAGYTQPNTGLPQQLVAGAQLSLSNLKKAGISLDAARKNCEFYKASSNVLMALQYALPALEKDALTHRLTLIGEASTSLEVLIDQTNRMVAAQNMTRPMLTALISNRIKLESDRAEMQTRLAALYVPVLSELPLKELVETKQTSDVEEQRSLARLTRQNNWDVALTVGGHQQIKPVANGFEPYGEVSFNYNLAGRAIDKHLDRSVAAYGEWKKVQESDVARGLEVLKEQIQRSIAVQKDRLKLLQQETQEVEGSLEFVSAPQTAAALDFRNQLVATQILLGIEMGDATYRRDHLQGFLDRNF